MFLNSHPYFFKEIRLPASWPSLMCVVPLKNRTKNSFELSQLIKCSLGIQLCLCFLNSRLNLEHSTVTRPVHREGGLYEITLHSGPSLYCWEASVLRTVLLLLWESYKHECHSVIWKCGCWRLRNGCRKKELNFNSHQATAPI